MSEILPVTKITVGSLPPDVLVCGDPERADLIGQSLDNVCQVAWNREYRVLTGSFQGVRLAVCSHGVGAAGAAVCFEELIMAGARRMIRIGTAGSLEQTIQDGALVIATGAIREDGMTAQLVPLTYPALADMEITAALADAAASLGLHNVHKGIVLTVGAFYPGLLDLPNNLMSRAKAKAVEMECSALFIVASLRGVQAGAIMAIDGMAIDFDAGAYNPHREQVSTAIKAEIDIALSAVLLLNRRLD